MTCKRNSMIFGKIIFLDFDGVMTNYSDEFGSYVTHEPAFYGPSESNVKRLRALCEKTGARVVITSNWRKFDEDGRCSFWTWKEQKKTVKNPLPQLKEQIGDLILCMLPKLRHLTKADVLKTWLEDSNICLDELKFVIFDDDVREGFQDVAEFKDNFIKTDPAYGITDEDVKNAATLLN